MLYSEATDDDNVMGIQELECEFITVDFIFCEPVEIITCPTNEVQLLRCAPQAAGKL